ncbi:MAG: BamA/TamA family outer membrane protein [Bacteroidales bacterium]|jgi:outer membrane protein assembly factor BamA
MRKSQGFLFISVIALLLNFMLSGCAATRYVPEEEYLLKKNTVEVVPKKIVPVSSLTPYIRQKPNTSIVFGWKAFLNIYSLSPDKDNGWSRFLRRLGEPPVVFDPMLIDYSKRNIDNYLTSLGYYFNTVSDSVTYHKQKATVHYTVMPGKTYTVDSIALSRADTNLARLYDLHLDQSHIRTGDRLSSLTLEKEAARISTVMRNNGYYNFNRSLVSFRADTLKQDGTASLEVLLPADSIQKPYRIRDINVYPGFDPMQAVMDSSYYSQMDTLNYRDMVFHFTGKPTIRPRIIRNMSYILPGELYDESKVKTTYDRFSHISLFNGVTLLFDEVPESGQLDTALVDCTIRLSPGNSQGYKLNLEASSNSNGLIGISPALSYYHKNIFRGGEWLTLGFMGNFQFKLKDPTRATELGASLSLSFPKMLFPISQQIFRGRVPRTDISASYNYQSRPEYTRNIVSTTFGYVWSMGENFHYTVNPLRLKLVKLYNMSPGFLASLNDPFLIDTYRDHFDLGFSTIFYYTSDNATVHRNSWHYIRVGLESAGNLLSAFNSQMRTDTTGSHTIGGIAYSQYIKVDLNTGYTFIRNAHQLAGRFYAGIGVPYGNGSTLPLEQMFFSGGANSMRGWQARTVGPGSMPVDSTFTIPNQAGDIRLEVNLEYRFPLFWKLEGAIFADAGNIWTLPREEAAEAGVFRFNNFYKSIAMDTGLGIRVNLDFVILRLDMGMIVRDPVKQAWVPVSQWLKRENYAIQFGVGYPF